jgi:hypothetical protein
VIFDNMRTRIARNNIKAERLEAIKVRFVWLQSEELLTADKAMTDIASDRASKLV